MRTLLSVFVLLLMTVPPFMNVTAVPDTPDFDESGIRTTQDFKDVESSYYVLLEDSSDCAIKWFYDDDNIHPDSEVYLKIWGSYYGTASSTASLSVYIYNNNYQNPQLRTTIKAHDYFANTEGLSFLPQFTYIPLGTKGSLGVKGDDWNSLILIDNSLSNKENVIIRVDADWPNVADWDGTSYAIKRSYYSSSTSSSSCLERSKNHYNYSSYYQDELMMMLEYSRIYSPYQSDDGSWETYAQIDDTDDKVEKRMWVSAPEYSTYQMLYMWAASAGSANPPWAPGPMKLSVCTVQHTSSKTCPGNQYIMTINTRFFNYGSGQWGGFLVPTTAFPNGEGWYYFMIYKTDDDQSKEQLYILISNTCGYFFGQTCNSRWKWYDGSPHGNFKYYPEPGYDQGELMIRLKPVRQWDDGPTFKEYTVLGPTLYDPADDLSSKGPDKIDSRLQSAGWRRTAYYKNTAGQQIKKEFYYGENYGGSSTAPLQNAGDDSDFIYLNAHGGMGYINLADGNEYVGCNGEDFA